MIYILDDTHAHCMTCVSCLRAELDLCILHNGHVVTPHMNKRVQTCEGSDRYNVLRFFPACCLATYCWTSDLQ